VKVVAVLLFLGGLLLAVRVMFFGVQRQLDDAHLIHRRWPLALGAFMAAAGAMFYARSTVTSGWVTVVVLIGVGLGAGAWWLVHRSASLPSTDPEDDPRYRFQGHVARVIEPIETRGDGDFAGRIAFDFDGRRFELRARFTPGEWERALGRADSEVVIERVEDEVAFVEPWAAVEERL